MMTQNIVRCNLNVEPEPFKHLKWSVFAQTVNGLTLWCILRSLTTAQKTAPPTIHELGLDYIIVCGNEVDYIGE